jgi:GTP-binding protein
MNIRSAEFVKGITGDDEILFDGIAQVAFIGRSNVGKSSTINALTNRKELARSSPLPGKTREINFFLINKDFYLVDLPGYGYAKGSRDERDAIQQLIFWYLTHPDVEQRKVVLIIDAKVGVTDSDLEMLQLLHEYSKSVVVIANKADKLKSSEIKRQFNAIEKAVKFYPVIPFSAEKRTGLNELIKAISS